MYLQIPKCILLASTWQVDFRKNRDRGCVYLCLSALSEPRIVPDG